MDGIKTDERWSELRVFPAHAGTVNAVCLSQELKTPLIATGGSDKKVNLWSLDKPNCLNSLVGHVTPVVSVRFSMIQNQICAGSQGGVLKIWDYANSKNLRTLMGHRASIRCTEYHPHGGMLISGSSDSMIKLWDIRKRDCISGYKGHNSAVNVLKFSPNGKWVASGGEDHRVKIWDLRTGKVLREFSDHEAPISSLAFHPTNLFFSSCSGDQTFKIYNMDTLTVTTSMKSTGRSIKFVVSHPDGKSLYVASEEIIQVYEWSPCTNYDSLVTNWPTTQDMVIVGNELFAVSSKRETVAVASVKLHRVKSVPVLPEIHDQCLQKPDTDLKNINSNNDKFETMTSSAEAILSDGNTIDKDQENEQENQGNKTYVIETHEEKESPEQSSNALTDNNNNNITMTSKISLTSEDSNAPKSHTMKGPLEELKLDTLLLPLPLESKIESLDSDSVLPISIETSKNGSTQHGVLAVGENSRLIKNSDEPQKPVDPPPVDLAAIPLSSRLVTTKPTNSARASKSENVIIIRRQKAPVETGTHGFSNIANNVCKTTQNHVQDVPKAPSTTTTTAVSKSNHHIINPRSECASKLDDSEQDSTSLSPSIKDLMSLSGVSHSSSNNNNIPTRNNEIIYALSNEHKIFMKSIVERNRNLQVLYKLWQTKDLAATAEAAFKLNDLTIVHGMLEIFSYRPSLWNLDLCVILLPAILSLLQSRHEHHIKNGFKVLRILLTNFECVIKECSSSPETLGVNLCHEERRQKCILCYKHLVSIREYSTNQKNKRNGSVFIDILMILSNVN